MLEPASCGCWQSPSSSLPLSRPAALKDLESLEPAFYNSLLWIQENDPEPLDLTFTVEEEAFGQLTMHELKSGGMDIPVTDDNKQEYIGLMIQWRLDQGVAKQMDSLKKGFNEVCLIGRVGSDHMIKR